MRTIACGPVAVAAVAGLPYYPSGGAVRFCHCECSIARKRSLPLVLPIGSSSIGRLPSTRCFLYFFRPCGSAQRSSDQASGSISRAIASKRVLNCRKTPLNPGLGERPRICRRGSTRRKIRGTRITNTVELARKGVARSAGHTQSFRGADLDMTG